MDFLVSKSGNTVVHGWVYHKNNDVIRFQFYLNHSHIIFYGAKLHC